LGKKKGTKRKEKKLGREAVLEKGRLKKKMGRAGERKFLRSVP